MAALGPLLLSDSRQGIPCTGKFACGSTGVRVQPAGKPLTQAQAATQHPHNPQMRVAMTHFLVVSCSLRGSSGDALRKMLRARSLNLACWSLGTWGLDSSLMKACGGGGGGGGDGGGHRT